MRKIVFPLAGLMAAGALTLVPAVPALAAGHVPESADYSFVLVPADTAISPGGGMMAGPGDRITVRGAGKFDPASLTIRAGGTFTHYNADGTVICRGTWTATNLNAFTDFGPGRHGTEGGTLSVTVTHRCPAMGMTMTGIPMTITSAVNAPAGVTDGVTVGEFTQPAGGSVRIYQDR